MHAVLTSDPKFAKLCRDEFDRNILTRAASLTDLDAIIELMSEPETQIYQKVLVIEQTNAVWSTDSKLIAKFTEDFFTKVFTPATKTAEMRKRWVNLDEPYLKVFVKFIESAKFLSLQGTAQDCMVDLLCDTVDLAP